MSSVLSSRLSSHYHVTSSVRPNAQLLDIVKEAAVNTKYFTFSDYVVIIGGTNDVKPNSSSFYQSLQQALPHIYNLTKHTNVIFCSVLPRFDDFKLNYSNNLANYFLYQKFLTSPSKNIIFLNTSQLDRQCFTRHGLHLNFTGKSKLSLLLARLINLTNLTQDLPPVSVNTKSNYDINDKVNQSSQTKIATSLLNNNQNNFLYNCHRTRHLK